MKQGLCRALPGYEAAVGELVGWGGQGSSCVGARCVEG